VYGQRERERERRQGFFFSFGSSIVSECVFEREREKREGLDDGRGGT
jgi:hypothetical protein